MTVSWLDQVLSTKQVDTGGGIVRRQTSGVRKYATRQGFIDRAIAEGTVLIFETAGQMVAVFKPESVTILCKQPPL